MPPRLRFEFGRKGRKIRGRHVTTQRARAHSCVTIANEWQADAHELTALSMFRKI